MSVKWRRELFKSGSRSGQNPHTQSLSKLSDCPKGPTPPYGQQTGKMRKAAVHALKNTEHYGKYPPLFITFFRNLTRETRRNPFPFRCVSLLFTLRWAQPDSS
jgi:hypothetical protein